MARLARAELVDPLVEGTYHCMNRCVRHAYLLGDDPITGKNYDHRKQWLEERIALLATIFGIDVLGYSIMSNHFHLILRNRPDVVAEWSDTEVAERWLRLCPLRKNRMGNALEPTDAELDTIRNNPEQLNEIRRRLSDISWMMRMIAGPIARLANGEDQTDGRFWQGRYKCVKLCDPQALLACLAYVDLNPLRAGMAELPEECEFTSLKRRLESYVTGTQPPGWLAPLEVKPLSPPFSSATGLRASDKGCLSISIEEYLELVDWTGRHLIKPGNASISSQAAPILDRLGITATGWLKLTGRFGQLFYRVAGTIDSLAEVRPYGQSTRRFRPGQCHLFGAA